METTCKVLIVDDEMLVRQGIIHLLDWRSEGFEIVGEAANGKEALEMVDLFQPHIILTDVVMPVMGGEELTRIVKGIYPETEIVVLSSFGEFEYVRSTFKSGVADYMLKPKLDKVSLLAVLRKTAQRIPALKYMEWTSEKKQSVDYFLDKLIAGYQNDYHPAEIDSMFIHPCFALLIIAVQDSSSAIKRYEEWVESGLQTDIALLGKPFILRRISHQDHYIRFLLNLESTNRPEAIQVAEHLAEAGIRGNMPLCVALSRNFSGIDEIHEVYSNEILRILDHRFFLPNRNLLVVNEYTEDKSNGSLFDHEAFNAELNRQDFHLALQRLNSYVQSMPGRMDIDMFEFKSFVCHSLFNIIGTLMHLHYEADALDKGKYEYFRFIHEAEHIEEVIPLVEKFLKSAVDCVENKSNPLGIQKILLFIDEHFSNPLTLTDVAKHFHFNPSYLSNYFALHNKEGFIEYLNRVRIEKACVLLREKPHLTISEISNLVGYSDHSYFTKVFRKLMGTSPSHYRKK